MWTWHGKRYVGVAHGVAGILHTPLLCPADILPGRARELADGRGRRARQRARVVRLLPLSLWLANPTDWCHGAPGLLLCAVLRCVSPAADPRLLATIVRAVQAAAARVYHYGLLAEGLGLCHGVASSVYALLAAADVLDRAEGKAGSAKSRRDAGSDDASAHYYYLARAAHLAHLAAAPSACTPMRVPDCPLSLYEGAAGMCCAWAGLAPR
ncbi:hypothetical protein B0H10DRAFT_2330244 [Mycena sp. CBHHK59/15]|nr:hypothetical protein B0H10DRAFT_2330244 [Mycena sp. CBHHK59/15]